MVKDGEDGVVISEVRPTGDVSSMLQFLLATHPMGSVCVVDGSSAVRGREASCLLPRSRLGFAGWAQSTAAFLEEPQRSQRGLRTTPAGMGPRSEARSWTAALNVSAGALAGVGGDLSVMSTALMYRLGVGADDALCRWIGLSTPAAGRFAARVQVVATPLDDRDVLLGLLDRGGWVSRVAVTVCADAERGLLL